MTVLPVSQNDSTGASGATLDLNSIQIVQALTGSLNGTLTVPNNNTGTIVYTQGTYQSQGIAVFSYTIMDTFGNVSNVAKVTLIACEPLAKTVNDMAQISGNKFTSGTTRITMRNINGYLIVNNANGYIGFIQNDTNVVPSMIQFTRFTNPSTTLGSPVYTTFTPPIMYGQSPGSGPFAAIECRARMQGGGPWSSAELWIASASAT